MKFIVLAIALFCAAAYVTAEVQHEEMMETYNPVRFRREANPQGSIEVKAQKSDGPNKQASLDIDYKHKIYERNGMNANAYGNVNIRKGQRPESRFGIEAERNFKNGHIGGFGEVQRLPGGRLSPTIGIIGRYRFKRDADEIIEQEEEQ